MTKVSRYSDALTTELKELISKSTPYSLSSPSFGNPTIHDFVKGLILSTNIITVIDKYIPNGYRADWGQIIDKKTGNALSNENDIIIYEGKPGCKTYDNKSMRFVLVDKEQAKIVIQVRSSISCVTNDDRSYCNNLLQFVPYVWYFVECCFAKSKNRVDTIRRELKKAGYNQFFYFYRMDTKTLSKTIEDELFVSFIEMVKKIK